MDPKSPRSKAGPSAEAGRVQELEQEVVRKDQALAETAALLVLKKSPGDLGGRGRHHAPEERALNGALMQRLIDEAVAARARRAPACRILGLSVRTMERWRAGEVVDQRHGPHTPPANALSAAERTALLTTVNSPAYTDFSPHQIVPRPADAGPYLASASTIYRVLRSAQRLAHRGRAAAPRRRLPPSHEATGPHQVWSWDITYLRTPVRCTFWYLYLILDIWSRKMAWRPRNAAPTRLPTWAAAALDPAGIVLHADHGGPMKGGMMLATLERLRILPSFSRRGLSNDNPYSEALFRTVEYRPDFPRDAFADLASATAWVAAFVAWYHDEHQHSAIRFVSPAQRLAGSDVALLAHRDRVYAAA